MSTPTPSPAPGSSPTPRKPRQQWRLVAMAAVLALLTLILISSIQSFSAKDPSTYSDVFDHLDTYAGYSATIDDASGQVTLTKDGKDPVTTVVPRMGTQDAVDALNKAKIDVTVKPVAAPSIFTNLLYSVLPVMMIIGFLIFFMNKRGMGIPGLGLGKKSGAVEVPTTRFADVAGAHEATEDLQEVVSFLHDPERFQAAGAQIPRGFLLVGPPGTGKTLLARAVAGEAGVPFFAVAGSDLVEMFVGLGASRVRELFSKAREAGKAIIFIDEIDAIGKARGGSLSHAANDEREQTLNQLLVEMDGFARNDGVIVLAATNRADVLDSALLRPGRFDRKITVPAPDKGGREQLLRLYAAAKNCDETIDWASFARRTAGMTGADISQLLNEAALTAARRGATFITAPDVESALGVAMLGRERRSAVMTEKDRSIVAWHEAGHTLAAMLVPGADRPVSVTIIPRGPSGGSTWMDGAEDQFTTRTQAKARLIVAMAGRAAEEVLLSGDYTHGAHGDLASATSLATSMVTQLGMAGMLRSVPPEAIYAGGAMADEINAQIQHLIGAALEEARLLVRSNEELLRALVAALLEKETLTEADLAAVAQAFEE